MGLSATARIAFPVRVKVVAPEVVAEDEADDVLEDDGEGDRCDGRGERAARPERAEHEVVVDDPEEPRHDEGDDDGQRGRQAEGGVGHVAREGADGGMGGHREVRKAEHGVDGREADGRHGQDRAGHHPVDDELGRLHSESRGAPAAPPRHPPPVYRAAHARWRVDPALRRCAAA
jgi:hypothetical protein